MHDNKLSVDQLNCIRQNKCLFKNLSFELIAQEILLVEGSNGSGKSSLLRLLAGLSTAEHGEIHWNNKNIRVNYDNYRQDMHYIGHSNGLKLGLTVLENLQLAKQLHSSAIFFNIDEVLTELNLYSHKQTYVNELSAGQKRKVSLARVLLFPKTLWIVDEPYTSLDSDTQELFSDKLKYHCEQGGMAVISSHHAMDFGNILVKKLRLG